MKIEQIVGTGNCKPKDKTDYRALLHLLINSLNPGKGDTCPPPFTYEVPEGSFDLSFTQTESDLKIVVCNKRARCLLDAVRCCLERGFPATIAWVDEEGVVQCFQVTKEIKTDCEDFYHLTGCSEICIASKVSKFTVYCECGDDKPVDPPTPVDPTANYLDTGCVFTLPIELCDEKAWFCTADPGSIYRFNPMSCKFEKVEKSMTQLGKPTPGQTGKNCEEVELDYECVNDTGAPITVTCDAIVAKAIAGAIANGQTFPNGDAITADALDLQFVHAVDACVACNNTPVKLDDGSVFIVTCDAGSLCVNPNGGSNGTSYSCGSSAIELGGGPREPGEQIGKTDSITILPGGAVTGRTLVGRCYDRKTGELIDCSNPPVEPPFVEAPAIEIVKIVTSTGPYVEGDTISGTYTVTNTGNVDLAPVTVTDSNAAVAGSLASLAVGASDTSSFTWSHVVTAAEIAAQEHRNQATATGTSPAGTEVSAPSGTEANPGGNEEVVIPLLLAENPSIQIVKLVTSTGPYTEGDTISGTYTVTNDGDVVLAPVTVTDDNAVVTGGPLASLAVGASDTSTFTWSHVVTAGELAVGEHRNQATATGTSPAGAETIDLSGTESVPGGDDPVVVPIAPAPAKTCYELCGSVVPGPNSATYTRRADTGVANPDGADSAAPGGPFFNVNDADGIPSIDLSVPVTTETLGPGSAGGHFNDPSSGTTNDYHESGAFLAIPPAACLGAASGDNILISAHNYGDAHQSIFAGAGWDRSAMSEIGRYSEDSFAQSGSLPILAGQDFFTGPAPQDGTISLPLSGDITAATVHANTVDERQQADVWWRYSLDDGATWIEMPRDWFYANAADAAQATPVPQTWCCEDGICSLGTATQSEAEVIAAGGVEVACPVVPPTPTTPFDFIEGLNEVDNNNATANMCGGTVQVNLNIELIDGSRPVFNNVENNADGLMDGTVYDPPAVQREQAFYMATTAQDLGVDHKVTINFSQPVTNPTIFLENIERTALNFGPYHAGLVSLTASNGNLALVGDVAQHASDPTATSAPNISDSPAGARSGAGSVQIQGTYSQICYDYVVQSDATEQHHMTVGAYCP